MSNQSGFDYDLLVSRLHGGLCAFQSLRAHRRERAQAAAPASTAEERVTAPPRAAHVVDEAVDLRAAVAVEPQAFVTMGGRMVPVFDLGAGLPGSMAQAPATDRPSPPAPAVTSAPEETRPPTPTPDASTPTPSAPAALASTLKLPAPTPPPRLGLVHGGHGRAPAPTPGPAPQSDAATPPPAATSEPHAARAGESSTQPSPVHEAPNAAALTMLLDARAEQEALRLEKLHAEHRGVLATLLQEHREELRARSEAEAARETQRKEELQARSEAEAARTTQLLREVFQEHRAELARTAKTHAEQLAQLLSQHQSAAQHEAAAETDLRGALIEQATLQREANEDVAANIDALTAIVADLGQTVGLLAVAAAKADKQGRLPTRTLFAPPPRVDPAIVASAPCAAVVPDAARHVEPAAPRVEPTAAANAIAPEPAASPAVPASSARSGPAASTVPRPTPCLADTIAVEPAQRRSIPMTLAEEAAARDRVSQAVDEDRDDDDLETADDDQQPHRPLGPITALDHPTHEEPRDD